MNMKRLSYPLLAAILLLTTAAGPSSRTTLAPLLGARDWLNGRETAQSVAGRVVLVDVFTYDCINCRNIMPTLQSLYRDEGRNGLVVVGVHSPETPAEKQRSNVVENLQTQGIVWPVAIDNDYTLWNAYGVDAWPTQLFFDRHGRLREAIAGDSHEAQVRAIVRQLLSEH